MTISLVVGPILLFLLIPGPVWIPIAMMLLLLLPWIYFSVALRPIWQRHRLAVRMAAAVAVYFALLSLGTVINIKTHSTGVPGPWRLLVELPLFDSVVPARFGLGATAAVGVLLALGIDGAASFASRGPAQRARLVRAIAGIAVVATLVPLLPHWVNTNPEPSTPAFLFCRRPKLSP